MAVKNRATRTDKGGMELLAVAAVLFVLAILYVMRRRVRQGKRQGKF